MAIQPASRPKPREWRRDSLSASAYYSPDSTARQVTLPAPRPAPRKRVLQKRRPDFAVDVQARHRHNFLSYVLVFALFGCVALGLAAHARLTYNHSTLEEARTRLVALQSANAVMEGAIIAGLDFAEIERIAVYELGMTPAEEFQYFVINVRPGSFLNHNATEPVPVSAAGAFDRFRNILHTFSGDN